MELEDGMSSLTANTSRSVFAVLLAVARHTHRSAAFGLLPAAVAVLLALSATTGCYATKKKQQPLVRPVEKYSKFLTRPT